MISIDFWNIGFTVINLLILFVAFRIFFFKPIRKIIEQRQAEVDAMYNEVTDKQNEANSLKLEYEEKVMIAETEKKQILSEARKSADGEYQHIVTDAKHEANRIHRDAVAAAEHEKEEIIGSARKEIAQMVVEATTKVVGSIAAAKIDSELYDKFLGKAGE